VHPKGVITAFACAVTLCAAGSVALAQAGGDRAPARVKLAEISRSPMYLALYGALAVGVFKRHALDMVPKTTLGPDATMAALLSGEADFGLAGPEQAIYAASSAQRASVKIFAALLSVDGTFLLSRTKMSPGDFRWDMLKGKTVIGWRSGSTPSLFFEQVLRSHRIDPHADFDYRTRMPVPVRVREWRAGRGDFAVFFEPEVSRFEREGVGYPVASIGKEAGASAYTVFMATADFIRDRPDVVQRFTNAIQEALTWAATVEPDEAAKAVAAYLPDTAHADIATAIRRYRAIGFWQTDPTVGRRAIAGIQSMMIASGVMPSDKRVVYEAVVEPRFAENAKRAAAGR
jgi:NitT/TauT family transport system substrate-binding protein